MPLLELAVTEPPWAAMIASVIDMYPLTVDGLTESMNHLRRTA